MKTLFICLALAIASNATTLKIPFDFSADENLKESDFRQVIKQSNELQKNEWLSSPPTRLELSIFMLDQYYHNFLNEYRSFYENLSQDYFDGTHPATLSSETLYNQINGSIVTTINVSAVGKPIKPMKDYCMEILDTAKIIPVPMIMTSFKKFPEDPLLNKNLNLIQKNSYIEVNIRSIDLKEKKVYQMECLTQFITDQTYFQKSALKIIK